VRDPANCDARFARARWRALAGLLAEEGLTPERIVRLGSRLRRADLALQAMAGGVAAELVEAPSQRSPGDAAGRAEGTRLDFARLAGEPEEIVLRVLVQALRSVTADAMHLRLERVESALGALQAAHRSGAPLRRSLAGCVLTLDAGGTLTIRPEPPRRRGR
jgi:tRNA(Ile)-lysidine synthase